MHTPDRAFLILMRCIALTQLPTLAPTAPTYVPTTTPTQAPTYPIGTNLVQNGCFDKPDTTLIYRAWYNVPQWSKLGAWTVTRKDIDQVSASEISDGNAERSMIYLALTVTFDLPSSHHLSPPFVGLQFGRYVVGTAGCCSHGIDCKSLLIVA